MPNKKEFEVNFDLRMNQLLQSRFQNIDAQDIIDNTAFDVLPQVGAVIYITAVNSTGSPKYSLGLHVYDGTNWKKVEFDTPDLTAVLTAGNDAGSLQITNLGAGTADDHAVNYGQLSAVASGLKWTDNVKAATTGNIALTGVQNIDGAIPPLAAGDAVLVKNQTNKTENGVYTVAASAWPRRTGDDTPADLNGQLVHCTGGATNGGREFAQIKQITLVPSGIGTDPVEYILFGGTSPQAGDGLQDTGGTFEVKPYHLTSATYDGTASIAAAKVDANGTGLKIDDKTIKNPLVDPLDPTKGYTNIIEVDSSQLAGMLRKTVYLDDGQPVPGPLSITSTGLVLAHTYGDKEFQTKVFQEITTTGTNKHWEEITVDVIQTDSDVQLYSNGRVSPAKIILIG